MIEADFKQRRGGSVRGNVAADAVVHAVGANHHGQRVPANQALDAALDFLIAGEHGLLFQGNGIDVGSIRGEGVSRCRGIRAWPRSRSSRSARRFLAFLASLLRRRILSIPAFPGDRSPERLCRNRSPCFLAPCARLAAHNSSLRPIRTRAHKNSLRHGSQTSADKSTWLVSGWR